MPEPVLIAGGGIAGLSTAIALARKGIASRVLEREASPPFEGAGIQLGPNATCLLQEWGVLGRLSAAVARPQGVLIQDGLSGEKLATVPLGQDAEQRYGAPYCVLHRGDLVRGLLNVAKEDNIAIETGFAVTGIEDGNHLTAHAADGRRLNGVALIAADGAASKIRARLFPQASLKSVGLSAWRMQIEQSVGEDERKFVRLWMGPAAHLVAYPIRGGQALNIVAIVPDTIPSEGWSIHGDEASLKTHFESWSGSALDVLSRAQGWRKWSLGELQGLQGWHKGKVALVGDAAHPVLPFLAQGGALAIEDAAAIANLLAIESTPTDAFAAFDRLRHARVSRVQQAARRMGRVYHMSGLAKTARNFVLRRRSPEALLRSFDWLYGYRLPKT